MAESEIEKKMDPETEFLASKRMSGTEWETFKENVRPLKRGRNVNMLNHALLSHTNNNFKNHLIQQRRFVPSLFTLHSFNNSKSHLCIHSLKQETHSSYRWIPRPWPSSPLATVSITVDSPQFATIILF